MKRLILIAALALAACDNVSALMRKDKPVEDVERLGDKVQVVGNGQVLTAPGVKVLVGPASIREEFATLPLVVVDAPPMVGATQWPALSCALFDAQHRLIAAQGGEIPLKLHGGSMSIRVDRPVGSAHCTLGVVPVEDR
jgi:hypothetical protein